MKYKIIYADPPWEYRRKVGQGVAADHYSTLDIEELRRLPVAEIADSDSVLFLWTTFPVLEEALSLFKYWGFTYKTCAFNWVKRNRKSDDYYLGLGFWTRSNSEICLLGTRGHPKRVSKSVRQICDARIMQHSQKPDEIRDRIVELCGDLPRIELFARQKADGWKALGNEIDGMDIRESMPQIIGKEKTEMEEKMIPIIEIEERNDVAKRERCAAYVKGMRTICLNNRMEKESKEKADWIGGVRK